MIKFLKPTFLHGIVILLGGIAFAVVGCLGALSGLTSNNPSPIEATFMWLGGAGFIAGCLAFLIGGLLLIIAIFNALFGKRDSQPPAN